MSGRIKKDQVNVAQPEHNELEILNRVVETHRTTVIPSKAKLDEMLEKEKNTQDIIYKFKDMLTEGVDYGTITISRKNKSTGQYYDSETKPSLFKPGAEKFNRLFNARAKYERDDATWEMFGMEKGVICYKCILIDEYDNFLGEGKGVSVAGGQSGYGDFDTNKQVKIAKKRAYVDATLTTYGLSEYFTQDMEDADSKTKGKNGLSKDETGADEVQYSDEQQAMFRVYSEKVRTAKTKDDLNKVEKDVMADSTLDGKMKHTVRTQIDYKRKVIK